MARHVSEEQKRASALQAARRMIARGDRPGYRLVAAQDGTWTIDALPWLLLAARDRRNLRDEARAAIAAWLDVSPNTFDVEAS